MKKRVLSIVLAAVMLVSVFAFGATASGPFTVTIERTQELIPFINNNYYRFKATWLDPMAVYEWSVRNESGTDITHLCFNDTSKNYFGFEPPQLITEPTDFTISVVVTLGSTTSTEYSQLFTLYPRLPLDYKEELLEAMIAASMFRENRYSPQTWANLRHAFDVATNLLLDGSLSTGTTSGAVNDAQQIINATDRLVRASQITYSGAGLSFDPETSGFSNFIANFLENLSRFLFPIIGISFGTLKLPKVELDAVSILGKLREIPFDSLFGGLGGLGG
ncbi:MAG: hypothetical protein FWG82_00745 [Oscillospiraceae bacterium]|nr:hypothetical protein [Oscillospiraceae bacterium]